MKKLLIALVVVSLLSGLCWALLRHGANPPLVVAVTVGQRAPARPTGTPLAGTLLAAKRQALRLPWGAHVLQVYCSEGQSVQPGDLLLKVAVGPLARTRVVFVSAPAAGEITGLNAGAGDYLAAATPYARLASSHPVRVQVAAAAAAHLRPGDSLQVLSGPSGLAGLTATLTAVLPANPATPAANAVLVLSRLRWTQPTTAPMVLALLHPSVPEVVAAH